MSTSISFAPTYLERFESKLHTFLAEQSSLHSLSEPLHQALAYVLLNPGKRFRPRLVYLCGEALGIPVEQLDAPALAVEFIHSYSLVHDDLPAMDNDDLRRGQASCHRAFNEATAILAGDCLQAWAFTALSSPKYNPIKAEKRIEQVEALAQAMGHRGLIGGQMMDINTRANQFKDSETVRLLHEAKTGALIQVSAKLVSLIPEALAPNQQTALGQFAQALGLAFQIKDDLLDAEEDQVKMEDKLNFLTVHGMTKTSQLLKETLNQARQALVAFGTSASCLQSLLKHSEERTV